MSRSLVQPPDNRAFSRILSLMLVCGALSAFAGEHDRTRLSHAIGASEARAQEPASLKAVSVVVNGEAGELVAAVEAPTFGLKERYDVGEPVVVSLLLPAGQKLVDVEWELPLRHLEPPDSLDTIYVWPVGAGAWQVRADYIADGGGKLSIRKHVETLKVGEPEPPPPPKPLIEIAGPDATKLYAVYYKLSKGSYTSLVHFHGVESAGLAHEGLADNPAVPVIAERLAKIAPFDGAKLVAELAKIAGELGKAPEPDKPDVPGTPVSFDGFHVVFVHESGAKERMQVYNLTAAQVLDSYLDSHCTNGANGWRVWDQHADVANAPPHFKELMALPRSTSPAMVVASGKRAAVLPVPTSPEEAVTILKQWGGE